MNKSRHVCTYMNIARLSIFRFCVIDFGRSVHGLPQSYYHSGEVLAIETDNGSNPNIFGTSSILDPIRME